MPHMIWTDDLNTGIDVIDSQHRRIVDFINQLHDTQLTSDKLIIGYVIDAMVEYTISHFGFEESLMEEAGYEFTRAHKKVHDLFIRRIDEMKNRFNNGEDVLNELQTLLTRWLFNHIKFDDAGYVEVVKPKIQPNMEEDSDQGWLSLVVERFFRSA